MRLSRLRNYYDDHFPDLDDPAILYRFHDYAVSFPGHVFHFPHASVYHVQLDDHDFRDHHHAYYQNELLGGYLDALEKLPPAERSIEQALALSQGHAAVKRLALAHLRGTIAKQGGAPDAESTKRLVQFARDADTAREVIGLFATLPGPVGPDLLYEFSTDKKTQPELAKLAEQLLLSKEVRSKASPALSLLLDLRDATACEARLPLLEKAPDVGDRRMLSVAVSYIKKTGCGASNRQDCNPCLRDDNSKVLRTAIAKVQGRKAPAL